MEPGRHGIGDYTLKLAEELKRNGLEIVIIALGDPYIKNVQVFGDNDETQIPILRLPSKWMVKQRIGYAKKWIDEFDPKWLSFQSCLFSFSTRGLPMQLRSMLKRIGGNRKWHIMFHELWLGESENDPVQHKILGILQKRLIKKLVKDLRPEKVFTSNKFYQECLAKINMEARIVPLFSNIPIGNSRGRDLFNRLPGKILGNRKNYMIATFFGSMHFSEELIGKVLKLNEKVKNENMELAITHVGRDNMVKGVFEKWQKDYGIDAHCFGECSVQQIADYFRQVDCGLSTYPKVLFEKSGSIAAMKQNNLPVILLRESFQKDDRNFHWIKEIDDISELGTFLNDNRKVDARTDITVSVDQYLKIFTSEKYKMAMS